MSTMYNLLHIPLCTVMLILIFNSTAYCHAHSFTFYILFFISYFSFILSYVYFPCVVFSIFALSMERTWLSFHCWLYSLCIVVYVTNKTWNLKLELEMTSDGLNQTLSSDKLQHEQRRASATSHCKLNWSVGNNIKRIHRLNYTEHSRKTFGNQLVMFLLACMFNVWTFKTVLLPCILHILRYYLMDDTTV